MNLCNTLGMSPWSPATLVGLYVMYTRFYLLENEYFAGILILKCYFLKQNADMVVQVSLIIIIKFAHAISDYWEFIINFKSIAVLWI